MGCPDWPKCFGSWTPPTSVEQLPSNYKENFSAYREKKNQKFARYLRWAGMEATADKILADKSILAEADFNATKTWIEYVNRLVGVIIGLFIIVLFYRSIAFKRSQPVLFWFSLATLVAVVFQGWFGSIVVSTNLTRWTITVHLFLALLIVGFLIYLVHKSNEKGEETTKPTHRGLLMACMITLLIQVFFGTEVRGSIDSLAASLPRESWISQLGTDFIVHRSFSWIVLILNALFFFQIRKTIALKTLARALFLLILCSLATGVTMTYFDVPAVIQPVHLLIATLAFGIQLFLFFRMNKTTVNS
jgi:cytochrome c oxidase assembly protein subunit 15